MPKLNELNQNNAQAIASKLLSRLVAQDDVAVELYPQQNSFVYTDAPYVAFVAGIGSGKTFAGCVRALRASLGTIGDRQIDTPNLGIITAPTYPMLRDVTTRTFLDVAQAHIASFNKSDMSIVMKNGSEILLRSAEHPDRLRGFNASWWYGDEAAFYRSNVWSIMIGRLRQFGRRGRAWLTTTPKGRNWVYKLFGQPGDEFELINAASADNVFLDREIIKAWEVEYSGDFARQELLGEFVSHQGLVYETFAQDRHVIAQTPVEYKQVIAGVDWGYANPGVILVGGIDSDGTLIVFEERYKRQQQIDDWAQEAAQLQRDFNVRQFVCDPSEPNNIKKFQQYGVPAEPANNSVMAGIQAVKHRLATHTHVDGSHRPRLLIARSCVNLISEMETYQWRETKMGMKDEPVKANDHAQDALRYMIMSLDNPKTRKITAGVKRYA